LTILTTGEKRKANRGEVVPHTPWVKKSINMVKLRCLYLLWSIKWSQTSVIKIAEANAAVRAFLRKLLNLESVPNYLSSVRAFFGLKSGTRDVKRCVVDIAFI
jgi:hypothetical protein